MIIEALNLLGEFHEYLKVCKDRRVLFDGAKLYRSDVKVMKANVEEKRAFVIDIMPTLRDGKPTKEEIYEINKRLVRGDAFFRPYPSMKAGYSSRSKDLVAALQDQCKEFTESKCTISSATILGVAEPDVLGVIATSDIKNEDVLCQEATMLVATLTNPLAK